MNQMAARPLQQEAGGKPQAVVIGAGFGGLAAAVRLGARGYAVTLCEALDAPGGRAYTYRQDGFSFDAGPTIITAPYLFEELWALCGKRMADDVTLRPLDPFYKIRFDDGSVLSYRAEEPAMREEVRRLAPGDVEGFDAFMKKSRAIYEVAFEEYADVPFDSFWFMLRTMPNLVRLGGHRSVYSTVSRYFRDPRLRVAFSFHPLLIGGNPMDTTAFYCLIATLEKTYGVHYALGGTGALVRGLVDLIEGQGGKILYDAPVARIETEGKRATGVVLADGRRLKADIVVSNADSAETYRTLLSAHPRKRWTDRKLKQRNFSMSLFVWYFGTKHRFDDVYHHTMILGPRYQELLHDIFKRKVLAEDFSLYLHRPSANDPSLAPPGCDTFYVLSPVPNLDSGTDWRHQAEPYRQAIQRRLEETVLPGLGDAIVSSHMLTPQGFQDRLGSYRGAGFSIEPQLFQSAWFRPHNKSEEIEGLYIVGAGTHPGAGVPGVLSSAKILERSLDKEAAALNAAR